MAHTASRMGAATLPCGGDEQTDQTSIPWDVGAVGTCGQIQPCNDVRLMDVPEMGVSTVGLGKIVGRYR